MASLEATKLEPKDSRSTLVDEPVRERPDTPQPTPSTPGSPGPFSASFDPNAPTPQTPSVSLVSPMTGLASSPSAVSQEMWRNSIAGSLNALASQFATASQALAAAEHESPASSAAFIAIEQAQARLKEELDSLREQIERLSVRSSEKEKERAHPEGSVDAYEARIQAVEKKVDDIAETIRLDQARLYARLLNSTITTNKMALTPLVMANGKTPQNFPATKGEFEHLTKERYEFMLKSYNVPLKGDTAAKRQLLREFIGLSPPKP